MPLQGIAPSVVAEGTVFCTPGGEGRDTRRERGTQAALSRGKARANTQEHCVAGWGTDGGPSGDTTESCHGYQLGHMQRSACEDWRFPVDKPSTPEVYMGHIPTRRRASAALWLGLGAFRPERHRDRHRPSSSEGRPVVAPRICLSSTACSLEHLRGGARQVAPHTIAQNTGDMAAVGLTRRGLLPRPSRTFAPWSPHPRPMIELTLEPVAGHSAAMHSGGGSGGSSEAPHLEDKACVSVSSPTLSGRQFERGPFVCGCVRIGPTRTSTLPSLACFCLSRAIPPSVAGCGENFPMKKLAARMRMCGPL